MAVVNITKDAGHLARQEKGRHKTKFKVLTSDIKRDRWLYVMLIPILVYFIIFKYIPMFGTVIAFKEFRISDGIFGSQWAGLKYFNRLFQSSDFYNILFNTLRLSFFSILFGFPLPVILSIMLNEIGNTKFKRTIQSIIYIPHFISWIVLGGIIVSLLSPSDGLVNIIIRALGGQGIYFMSDNTWWQVVFVISGIWQSVGWGTIIYLAAISGISPEMYEAATIDGAKKLTQIWHITLPSLRNTIAIMFILRMGSVLQVGFEQVYSLQNDMVLGVSEVISTYEYRLGIQGLQYSATTALGLFKGVINLIMIGAANLIVTRLSDGESGLW